MRAAYGNIVYPGDLPLPLDFSAFSGVRGGQPRAELEIGFGNGEFTVQRAAACPDTLLIGLEVSSTCVARCVRRMEGLANLKVICADARFMMKELFADGSFDRVYMNFPCPWPKNRHAERRVAAGGFADALAAVLKTGGVFEMVTDADWYAEDAGSALGRHEALSAAERETNPVRPVTTKYERKWLEMGKNITRLLVTKTKPFTVARETWKFYGEAAEGREEAMHVKTGKPLPGEGLDFLVGASGARREARWVFKKYYAAGGGADRAYLVETISADDGFEQRYYLKAAAGRDGALVKLDGTARVYLTPAVRCAVEDLARRLAERAE